jgi:hypothetical protein
VFQNQRYASSSFFRWILLVADSTLEGKRK